MIKKSDNRKCYKLLKNLYTEFLRNNHEAHDGLEIGLKKTNTDIKKFNSNTDYGDVLNDCWDAIRKLHRDARDFDLEKESRELADAELTILFEARRYGVLEYIE